MKSMLNEENSSNPFLLTQPDIIQDIERFISEKYSSTLFLCKPKSSTNKNTLYFIVDSQKPLDLGELSKIAVYIEEKIDFDDTYIQSKCYWSQAEFDERFIDKVEYTVSNRVSIEKFLERSYPKLSSYQREIKEHGLPFFEFEKMEREAAELLGKAIVDTCQKEVEAHSPTKEEDIAALLTNIIRLASQRGLDSSKIINQIDVSNLVQPIKK